jgi:hypothetical protein
LRRHGCRNGMGDDVIFRAVIALVVSGGLGACSSDRTTLASFAANPLMLPPTVTGANAATSPSGMPKKTMSDKILAAMALERVTGMKPDPDRFTP